MQFNDTYDGGALGNVVDQDPSVDEEVPHDVVGAAAVERRHRRSGEAQRRELPEGELVPDRALRDGHRAGLRRLHELADLHRRRHRARRLRRALPRPDAELHPGFPTGAGIPGYPYYDPAGPGGTTTPAGYLPNYPGVDGIDQIKTGGVVGNNDWIGLNPNPFPTGSAPTNSGNPAAPLPFNYNVANTVLRTNALHLAIAPGGVSVNMSTGTPTTPGGLPTAQGSQDVTLGYSGGQANLFGNIPGKNVGIDVTVNLATTINGIARIMDQDTFSVAADLRQRLPGGRLPLPSGVDVGGAELHPGRPSDGQPADRSGDHQGRQGPDRQGDGAVRRQQPRPRRAHRLPDGGVGVRRLQRRHR